MTIKPSRDIKLKRGDDSYSLDIPSCGRAYVPKVNFRRPGNLILGLFLIFLILLFAGLAFANEGHHHHYGNVNMVINVASIKTSDLRELADNQLFIPSKPIKSFDVTINVDKNSLMDDVTKNPGATEAPRVSDSLSLMEPSDRSRRDPPLNNIAPMVDYKRNILSIDLARQLLKTIPLVWPTNMTESEVLVEWAQKHELMTNEQNAQVARYLVDHFERVKRSFSDGVLVSFYSLGKLRVKRQSPTDCKTLKNQALWDNMEKKKKTVLGHHFFSINDLCVYFSHCPKGIPSPAGCDMDHDGEDSKMEYYASEEKMNARQDMIPGPDTKEICEIDGIVINKCDRTHDYKERVLFYRVLGISGFFFGPHSLTLSPLYSSLDDFTCEGNSSTRCIGDDIFKSLFTESGSDDTCSCKANTTKHMVHVKIGGSSFRIDAGFYEDIPIKIKKEKPEDVICSGCDVTCNHGQITIDYEHDVEMAELCSGRFCLDIKPINRFTVPLSLAAMDNTFNYYIKFSDNKEKSGLIQCKIDELCPLIDCHLCIEKLKNPHCYNALDKLNFIIIICTWFILLAIVVKVMKILILGVQIVRVVIRTIYKVVRSMIARILKLVGFDLVREREVTSRILEEEDGYTRTVSSERTRTSVRRSMPTYIKTLAILGLVASGRACSETMTMDAKQLDCQMSDGNLRCSTRSSASINVAPVGQSSCFIFKTADGQAAGTLTVKTISLDLLCNKEVLYWTYSPVPSFDQVCYCSGSSSGYGNDEACNKFNKDYLCGSPLKCDEASAYSHCKTARGGWGEGCFSYSDKFCYYAISLKNPTKKVYEVSTCSSFYWQATLEVVVQTVDGEEVVRSRLNPGSLATFTGGSIRLEGATIPPIPILSKCFIKSGDFTYIGECVKGTGIMSGMVGEIQCSSAAAAAKPTIKRCSHSPTIHNIIVQGGSLTYNHRLFSFSTLKKRLPVSSGGFTIKEKGGEISASLNYMSMISLRLSLSSMTLVPYSIMSKCTAKFIDAKGCVTCLSGSIMRIRIKTDEGTAKAILSCPSLKADIPFRVGVREEMVSLNAHFENGLIKETCKLTCPGGSIDLPIEASLTSDVQITRLFQDDLSDFTEVATNWFSGMFGQFQYYLLVPMVGVIILGSLILLKLMVHFTSHSSHDKSW